MCNIIQQVLLELLPTLNYMFFGNPCLCSITIYVNYMHIEYMLNCLFSNIYLNDLYGFKYKIYIVYVTIYFYTLLKKLIIACFLIQLLN